MSVIHYSHLLPLISLSNFSFSAWLNYYQKLDNENAEFARYFFKKYTCLKNDNMYNVEKWVEHLKSQGAPDIGILYFLELWEEYRAFRLIAANLRKNIH